MKHPSIKSILVIDDNETMREGIKAVVEKMGYVVDKASSGAEGLKLFLKRQHEFVISDLKMEGMDGMEVLQAIRKESSQALIMLITAYGTVETAVNAMKLGAFDFITKPFKPEVLRMKVQQADEILRLRKDHSRLVDENDSLRKELSDRVESQCLIGQSPSFVKALQNAAKVAKTESSVLITGESGTGKELVAQAIHTQSLRKEGPFIRVNCGALVDTLLESELFGHEKGSFTGAVKRKLGRFELATGGTIFLDEIGDISPALQVKLLRVLQEQEFDRVGGSEPVKVDVRVVSATNKDLKKEVEESRFREDLFYRLHVIPLHLPPLRERQSDIPLLADHFLHKLKKRTRTKVKAFSDEAMRILQGQSWNGNVRELENVVEQTLVFADNETVMPPDLPAYLQKGANPGLLDLPLGERPLPEMLDEIERQLILKAFQQAGGIKTETARLLGVKTSALYYKLEKYGIGDTTEDDNTSKDQ